MSAVIRGERLSCGRYADVRTSVPGPSQKAYIYYGNRKFASDRAGMSQNNRISDENREFELSIGKVIQIWLDRRRTLIFTTEIENSRFPSGK